jgi:transcriptional regulator of acetoin/glycerol metabolism
LSSYHWPGNIRELRNVLERSLMLSGLGRFRLALSVHQGPQEDWYLKIRFPREGTLKEINDQVIESLVIEALKRCHGSRKEAARLLGISRDSIHRYIRRFGLKGENLTLP